MTERPFSTGEALRYGLQGIRSNVRPLAVALAVLALGALAIVVLQQLLLPSMGLRSLRALLLGGFSRSQLVIVLLVLLAVTWMICVQGILSRVALAHTEGMKPTVRGVFVWDGIPQLLKLGGLMALPVLVAAILPTFGSVLGSMAPISAMLGALSLLCIFPMVSMGVFAVFFISKGVAPGTALVSSMSMTSHKPRECLRLGLVCVALLILGLLLLGIGLFFTVPLVVFMQTYAFKTLRKRPVAIWS